MDRVRHWSSLVWAEMFRNLYGTYRRNDLFWFVIWWNEMDFLTCFIALLQVLLTLFERSSSENCVQQSPCSCRTSKYSIDFSDLSKGPNPRLYLLWSQNTSYNIISWLAFFFVSSNMSLSTWLSGWFDFNPPEVCASKNSFITTAWCRLEY